MNDLPAGLTEPLHILEPWPWQRAAMLAALAAAGLLYLWWLWWRRRVVDRQAGADPAPLSTRSPLEEAVARILSRAHGSRNYRVGCHELARLLCGGLEIEHGSGVRSLTARELAARYGESRMTRLLLLLSELRFGRRSVGKRDLEGACELALEAGSGTLDEKR